MKRGSRSIFLNYFNFPLVKIKGALSSLPLLCMCVADGGSGSCASQCLD